MSSKFRRNFDLEKALSDPAVKFYVWDTFAGVGIVYIYLTTGLTRIHDGGATTSAYSEESLREAIKTGLMREVSKDFFLMSLL